MTYQNKRKAVFMFLISQVFCLICCQQSGTYTNPIINKGLADPFIFYKKGNYFLFATGRADDGRFIPIHLWHIISSFRVETKRYQHMKNSELLQQKLLWDQFPEEFI